ncbi:hypothetical protein HIM_09823 [Hirsutella minnesotensis 3608]|uniref:Uncharacterized protein n=1 Tax=Hirsutella minnesotensis 3608 TaxID=1043627 RepID=A0A0F7ZS55_9HYPO|nr:hypothetical protein HIM_09823 [Hirsutella minnesotensis 3608]
MSAGLASEVGCDTLLESPALDIPTLSASALGMKAIETILLDCVRLNYTLARQKWQPDEKLAVSTSTKDIRDYAEEIMGWGYEKAVRAIKNEHANFACKDIQVRYNKSIYWRIIVKYAKLLDPASLPTAKGRLDEFTMAEKTATLAFMTKAGYRTSYANQRRCRRFWKSLSDMREAGVDKILFYRTKEFDRFCEQHGTDAEPTLVQTVLSWEKIYGPHIEQLEERAKRESQGDLSGRFWLTQPHIAKRLNVPETSWNNGRNMWFSVAEEEHFKSGAGPAQVTSDQLGGLLDIHTAEGRNQNKSIFVSLLPRDENFLSVCPIITIQEGDFLGVFAGTIRYLEKKNSMYGIPGHSANLENLWLDYSHVTGILNQMRVSPPNGDANVCLQWELFEGSEGEACPPAWRVAVRALRTIKPFEELVRAAPNSEQYLRHRKLAHARRGYIKSTDAEKHNN